VLGLLVLVMTESTDRFPIAPLFQYCYVCARAQAPLWFEAADVHVVCSFEASCGVLVVSAQNANGSCVVTIIESWYQLW
jgi:hypothetical protein